MRNQYAGGRIEATHQAAIKYYTIHHDNIVQWAQKGSAQTNTVMSRNRWYVPVCTLELSYVIVERALSLDVPPHTAL